MKRNQFRHLIKEEMVNIFLNEMANYYKLKDNSSEAKKAVSMAKAKVKSDTKLWNALDTLEKEGEVDLIKLAYENDIDVSSYNNPQNRQVLDKELEDYIEKGKSPFSEKEKGLHKKPIKQPKEKDTSERGYWNFDIVKGPDGKIEFKKREIKNPIPQSKSTETSLFDKKTTINKKLKFPSDNTWSDAKKEEGKKLKKEWWNFLVKKGIMSYDEVYDKFKIVPERISDYEKELEKFIPKWEKKMVTINENRLLYRQLMEILI